MSGYDSYQDDDVATEALIKGFVQGAPVAIWTEADKFELCVLQVDEGFNFFSIHEGDEFQMRCISLSDVKGVHIGERAMKLCEDNSICDEHLSPSTVLVVLHGEFIGGPSKRNLCVFLVDTEAKQLKLKACFEAIYRRAIAGQTYANQGPAHVQAPPVSSGSGGRTSFGPGVGGGRTSFGSQRPVIPEASTMKQSASGGAGKWVPPPGYEDSDDEDGRTAAPANRISRNSFGPGGGPLNEPAPPRDILQQAPAAGKDERTWKYNGSSQNINSGHGLSAATPQRSSKVHLKRRDADDDSDDGLDRNPYAQKAKQDPSCSDRMCENSCVVQ